MKAAAQQLINLNIVPIPLEKSGDGKGCFKNAWETKHFKAKDFHDHNNIGINLTLSKKSRRRLGLKRICLFCSILYVTYSYFRNTKSNG